MNKHSGSVSCIETYKPRKRCNATYSCVTSSVMLISILFFPKHKDILFSLQALCMLRCNSYRCSYYTICKAYSCETLYVICKAYA